REAECRQGAGEREQQRFADGRQIERRYGEEQSARDHCHDAQQLRARDARRRAACQHPLGQPAQADIDGRRDTDHDGKPAARVDAVEAQSFFEVARQPGQVLAEHPVRGEAEQEDRQNGRIGEDGPVGKAGGRMAVLARRTGCRRLRIRVALPALARHIEPRDAPHQTDTAEHEEIHPPSPFARDERDQQTGEQQPERGALANDGDGQAALVVGEPLADCMDRGRERGAFGGAEYHAAHEDGERAGGECLRHLNHGPTHAHGQQQPARRNAVGCEADDDRRYGEEPEEAARDHPEFRWRQMQFGHQRHGDHAEHDLVEEIDRVETGQHERQSPGRARRQGGWMVHERPRTQVCQISMFVSLIRRAWRRVRERRPAAY
ncbi:conserved hypothetical protein, partial [Ricinus communis]